MSNGRHRYDVLQALIDSRGVQDYLEVGVWKGVTFNKLQGVPRMVGVDRKKNCAAVTHEMTSDEYFATHPDKFDLIFVDGNHEETQVYADTTHALQHLKAGGIVAMHDINPLTPALARKGDCHTAYRAFLRLRAERSDLCMLVVDVPHGVGLVWPGHQQCINLPDPFTFDDFREHRKEWLNLKSWQWFAEWCARESA